MITDCDQENVIKNKQFNSLICIWISRDPYSDKSMLDCSLDQSQVNIFIQRILTLKFIQRIYLVV
jgi:hypothetical protein